MNSLPCAGPAIPLSLAAHFAGDPAGDSASAAGAAFAAALALASPDDARGAVPTGPSLATPLIGQIPGSSADGPPAPTMPSLAAIPVSRQNALAGPVITPGLAEIVTMSAVPAPDRPIALIAAASQPAANLAPVRGPSSRKVPAAAKHSTTILAAVGARLAAKDIKLPNTAKVAIALAATAAPPSGFGPSAAPVLGSLAPPQEAGLAQSVGLTVAHGLTGPADSAKSAPTNDNDQPIAVPALLAALLPKIPQPSPGDNIKVHYSEATPLPNGNPPQSSIKTDLTVPAAAIAIGSAPPHATPESIPGDEDPAPVIDATASPAPPPSPSATHPVHDHALPASAIHALPTTAAPPAQTLHSAAPVPAPPATAPPGPALGPAAPVLQQMAITGAFGERIGLAIAHRVAQGQDSLIVRLDPAELGRIEISLAFDVQSGALRAVVATEHSSVLDALRRDSPELTRALAAAGLPTDRSSIQFDASRDASARGQSSGSTGQGHGQRHGDWARWADVAATATATAEQPLDAPRGYPGCGRLDLFA